MLKRVITSRNWSTRLSPSSATTRKSSKFGSCSFVPPPLREHGVTDTSMEGPLKDVDDRAQGRESFVERIGNLHEGAKIRDAGCDELRHVGHRALRVDGPIIPADDRQVPGNLERVRVPALMCHGLPHWRDARREI